MITATHGFCLCVPPRSKLSDHTANSYPITVASVLAPGFLPIDNGLGDNPLRTILLRHALTDPAFSQALISLASAHMDRVQGKSNNIETFRYTGEAIRLVNENLNSPQHAVADSTIAAVGILGVIEVSTVWRLVKTFT